MNPTTPLECRKPVVGLVGGIGSGKSLVADAFAQHGAYVINADRLGHEALRQPEIMDQVVARWGQAILDADGAVDRRKLAGIVFADERERLALEALVFPFIERRIREEVHRAEQDGRVRLIVLDAAILLETGWGKFCDSIVFVAAPREQRLDRLMQKRGWTAKEVAAREAAQLPLEEKRQRADAVIDNSGDPARTRAQVEQLCRRLVSSE